MKYLIHQKSGRIVAVEGERVTVLIEHDVPVIPTEEIDILKMTPYNFFMLYDEPVHTVRAINMARGFWESGNKSRPKTTVGELISLSEISNE